MNPSIRLIIIEDSEDDLEPILRHVREGGFEPEYITVTGVAALREALETQKWDMVLWDHAVLRFDVGIALQIVKESCAELPFVIVSGTLSEEQAVAAMKAGCSDYVFKNNWARLAPLIQREMDELHGKRVRKRIEEELKAEKEQQAVTLKSIGDGVITTDISGKVLFLNAKAEELTGWRLGEARGRLLHEIFVIVNKNTAAAETPLS